MTALPIISIVLCMAYVVFIIFKYGVPVSISETYYLLPSKWDWLFAAWTVLTSVPVGIYWFMKAPDNLKWIPITVIIAMLMIGVACCYKSGPKKEDGYTPTAGKSQSNIKNTAIGWISDLVNKFNPKTFFQYGAARLIHYANSMIAIILSTIYLCMTCGAQAIANTVISYVMFIIIGMKVDGVYNPDYSLDVNNKAWIFFMEIICLINLFVFIW